MQKAITQLIGRENIHDMKRRNKKNFSFILKRTYESSSIYKCDGTRQNGVLFRPTLVAGFLYTSRAHRPPAAVIEINIW